MSDDSRIVDQGRELIDAANYRRTEYERESGRYTDSKDYVVGRDSTGELDGPRHSIVWDRYNYRHVGIELAIQFAIENSDRKLLRVLEKMQKENEEAFKNFYDAYDLSFQYVVNANERAKRIENLREDLRFLENHHTDDFEKLREGQKTRSEKLKYASGKEEERLENEIALLEELINLKPSKRKKTIVAKQKEFDEVMAISKKTSSRYSNRYARLLRKAYKHVKNKYGTDNLKDLYSKAWDIIHELGSAVFVRYEDYNYSGGKSYLSEPKVEINEFALESSKKELVEKYYSNKKGKINTN